MRISFLYVSILALVSTTTIHAKVSPIIQIGFGMGGDEVATATYTNGDKIDLTTAGGVAAEGGIAITSGSKLETQLLVGYKSDSTNAKNGDITMSRVYLTALGMYNLGKVGVGAGVTYHLTPELSSSGDANGIEADFESVVGPVLQATYTFNKGYSVGLKATILDYKVKNSSTEFKAKGADLFLSYKF
jgi:hypothetical protein